MTYTPPLPYYRILFLLFIIISEFYTAFLCFYAINYWSFIFTQRSPFRISCKAGLAVMNSLSFCLSGKILPIFLKDSFTGCKILDWNFGLFFFPPSILNMSSHCFQSWKISVERSTISLIWGSLFCNLTFLLLFSKVLVFVDI